VSGLLTFGKLDKFPSHNNPVGSGTLRKSSKFDMPALKYPTSQNFNEWRQISPDGARVR